MKEKSNLQHIYWFAFYDLYSPSVRYRSWYLLLFASNCNVVSAGSIRTACADTFFPPLSNWPFVVG